MEGKPVLFFSLIKYYLVSCDLHCIFKGRFQDIINMAHITTMGGVWGKNSDMWNGLGYLLHIINYNTQGSFTTKP